MSLIFKRFSFLLNCIIKDPHQNLNTISLINLNYEFRCFLGVNWVIEDELSPISFAQLLNWNWKPINLELLKRFRVFSHFHIVYCYSPAIKILIFIWNILIFYHFFLQLFLPFTLYGFKWWLIFLIPLNRAFFNPNFHCCHISNFIQFHQRLIYHMLFSFYIDYIPIYSYFSWFFDFVTRKTLICYNGPEYIFFQRD